MGRLLDRYDAMQRRPLGTNTALSDGNQKGVGGVVGSQYRRQGAAYGQALRILNRQARRGDARSALLSIDTRRDAMNEGYTPGGIRNKAQSDVDIAGRVDADAQRNQDIARSQELDRRNVSRMLTNPVSTTGEAPVNPAPVNPNATVGVWRGTPIKDRVSSSTPPSRILGHNEVTTATTSRGITPTASEAADIGRLSEVGATTMEYIPERDGGMVQLGIDTSQLTPEEIQKRDLNKKQSRILKRR